MLQIRLSKPANETGVSAKPAPTDSVTVACPDHLVLADLPVAKSLGSASANAVMKTVGRRSPRHLGGRVTSLLLFMTVSAPVSMHSVWIVQGVILSATFVFDSEGQNSETRLKNSNNQNDFEWHINETHADLLHPVKEKEGNETEAISDRKSSASGSTVQAPLSSLFSPGSSSQVNDREDKTQQSTQSRDPQPPLRPVVQQIRPMPPFSGQAPKYQSEQQHTDSNQPHNRFPQQTFNTQGQVNNPNSVMVPPRFTYLPYGDDGAQEFFGGQYEMGRTDLTPEAGYRQGPLLGFMLAPTGPMNFRQNYPQQ